MSKIKNIFFLHKATVLLTNADMSLSRYVPGHNEASPSTAIDNASKFDTGNINLKHAMHVFIM